MDGRWTNSFSCAPWEYKTAQDCLDFMVLIEKPLQKTEMFIFVKMDK